MSSSSSFDITGLSHFVYYAMKMRESIQYNWLFCYWFCYSIFFVKINAIMYNCFIILLQCKGPRAYMYNKNTETNWPWKDTLGCRVSPLCHLQFRCNEPVSHFCKMRKGQITFHRKIFWTIFLYHIIGQDKLHFCEKLFGRFAFYKNAKRAHCT